MWGYPPISHYLRAVSIYLFGFHVEPVRWVSVIAGSISVVVLYYLGKSIFSKKIGAFAALLLCFSAFHILYSRLSMTEALVLFFMLMSSYFFWRGHKEKSWKYMCASGIFMGLAWNTKYIVLAVIPVFVLFIIWVERSWRSLIKKNFLIWLATIFLVISPVQLTLLINGANPYWWSLDWMFGPISLPQQVSHPFIELIPRGIKIFIYLSARVGSPWLPWLPAYEFALVVLFATAFLHYVHFSLKVRTRESFVTLSFLGPVLFLAVSPVRHSYWFIYSLPFCLIMIASFTFRCARSLRITEVRLGGVVKGLKAWSHYLKFFVLMLVFVVIFSNTVIGMMAPVIDRGEIEGHRLAMLYVRNHVRDGDSVAGWWGSLHMYYINLYNINVTFVPLEKSSRETSFIRLAEFRLDEQVLRTLKPRFIVIDRQNFDFRFNATMKEEVLRNYEIVWFSNPNVGYFWGLETDNQIYLVLERKSE